MVSEAGGAGAVVVFVAFVWDLAVFFGGWEGVVADGAGPGFGGSGHCFFVSGDFLESDADVLVAKARFGNSGISG